MTTTIYDEMDVIPAVVGVEFDTKGNPLGSITLEEWMDKLDTKLINHFGENFRIMLNESRVKRGMRSL